MRMRARADYGTPEEGIRRLAPVINTMIDLIPGQSVVRIDAAYTASQYNTILADCSATAVTVTLPKSGDWEGCYWVKKIDSSANAVTVVGQNNEPIDEVTAGATWTVAKDSYCFVPDGTEWWIF